MASTLRFSSLCITDQHISIRLLVAALSNALPRSSLQDHIQGEILFSDLFRLPSVGELYPGAARLPPAVLRSATGFPDLRALEADLHGNHRQVRGGTACWGDVAVFSANWRGMGACESSSMYKCDNIPLSGLLVGVESALWSLLLSLAICVAAVSVFTAHPLLLLPVLITILGKIWSRMFGSDTQKCILKLNIWAWVGITCVI